MQAMYLPPQFAVKDIDVARELIRAHPLASLVSSDDDGFPFVTHLPLHLADAPWPEATEAAPGPADTGHGEALLLLGHCAKPNPHWRYLLARPKALVVFMGPHAYMTPRVYPDLARVPTWNYLAVHCQVQAHMLESFDDKDHLLKHLIHDHDPAYAAQWRALAEDYQHRMMNGIVAFALRVTDVQCKVKLNQHRPEAHAAMHALYAEGNEDERQLAEWMERLGMTPPAAEGA